LRGPIGQNAAASSVILSSARSVRRQPGKQVIRPVDTLEQAPQADNAVIAPGDVRAEASANEFTAAIFLLLHGALRAGQGEPVGWKLDELASALEDLFVQCSDFAAKLAAAEAGKAGPDQLCLSFCQGIDSQQAKTLADAVNAVSTVVKARALGNVDQAELHAAWRHVWTSVTNLSKASERSGESAKQTRSTGSPGADG
jgi:hypothetical protein